MTADPTKLDPTTPEKIRILTSKDSFLLQNVPNIFPAEVHMSSTAYGCRMSSHVSPRILWGDFRARPVKYYEQYIWPTAV